MRTRQTPMTKPYREDGEDEAHEEESNILLRLSHCGPPPDFTASGRKFRRWERIPFFFLRRNERERNQIPMQQKKCKRKLEYSMKTAKSASMQETRFLEEFFLDGTAATTAKSKGQIF